MIRVVDKDVIIWFAVYHLPTPSSNRGFVPQENRVQVLSSDLLASVVL